MSEDTSNICIQFPAFSYLLWATQSIPHKCHKKICLDSLTKSYACVSVYCYLKKTVSQRVMTKKGMKRKSFTKNTRQISFVPPKKKYICPVKHTSFFYYCFYVVGIICISLYKISQEISKPSEYDGRNIDNQKELLWKISCNCNTSNALIFWGTRESSVVPRPSCPFWLRPQLQ